MVCGICFVRRRCVSVVLGLDCCFLASGLGFGLAFRFSWLFLIWFCSLCGMILFWVWLLGFVACDCVLCGLFVAALLLLQF